MAIFDQSFNFSNLRKEKLVGERDGGRLVDIIEDAQAQISNGFSAPLLTAHVANGKPVYSVNSFAALLVIRKLTRNFRTLSSVKQSSRDSIVLNLILLLEESVKFRVYRLDVKSFYESIDRLKILLSAEQDLGISRASVAILRNFFNSLEQLGLAGLPRGVTLSATLAERLMRDFDSLISRDPKIYFYSRYVDDIVIVTSGFEPSSYLEKFQKMLPPGLLLNREKSKYYDAFLKDNGIKNGDEELDFSFLGYHFRVFRMKSNEKFRKVEVGISPEKINKIKRKCSLAMYSFSKKGDFSLLRDRIKLLTSNYVVRDLNTGEKIFTGIFYNYKLVNKTDQLKDLDGFLWGAIKGQRTRLSKLLRRKLSKRQVEELLSFSFARGFEGRIMYSFTPHRLGVINGVWKNV
ncbi:antiviral reverse transcriptase Drt3a [Gilvimarinus chinensis]|uniref:antiviral reverse transcriptase Drt3a n=1 Tax=Gilvimarinus chinensis TaxID=396005 RepID=UPI000371C955|nr:antiviral reverse transcriptase Drt3a [Gilvimarinus chinensis]